MQKLEDPIPQEGTGRSIESVWEIQAWINLPKRFSIANADLFDVLEKRRSGNRFKRVDPGDLSALLWYSQRRVCTDRNDTNKTYGPVPTAGALASVRTIVIGSNCDVWLYDGATHRAGIVDADSQVVSRVRSSATSIFGIGEGNLLLFASDRRFIERYYRNPESLVLREAGVIVGTMGLIATALQLSFRPLGTQAGRWISEILDVREERIIPGGAAVVGSR